MRIAHLTAGLRRPRGSLRLIEKAVRLTRRWRIARRTAMELSAQGDHVLLDIGVERAEIREIARRLSRRFH